VGWSEVIVYSAFLSTSCFRQYPGYRRHAGGELIQFSFVAGKQRNANGYRSLEYGSNGNRGTAFFNGSHGQAANTQPSAKFLLAHFPFFAGSSDHGCQSLQGPVGMSGKMNILVLDIFALTNSMSLLANPDSGSPVQPRTIITSEEAKNGMRVCLTI
jgi:hypothetical protein